jgi:hypothetical protein
MKAIPKTLEDVAEAALAMFGAGSALKAPDCGPFGSTHSARSAEISLPQTDNFGKTLLVTATPVLST